jgi:hypothetical protein
MHALERPRCRPMGQAPRGSGSRIQKACPSRHALPHGPREPHAAVARLADVGGPWIVDALAPGLLARPLRAAALVPLQGAAEQGEGSHRGAVRAALASTAPRQAAPLWQRAAGAPRAWEAHQFHTGGGDVHELGSGDLQVQRQASEAVHAAAAGAVSHNRHAAALRWQLKFVSAAACMRQQWLGPPWDRWRRGRRSAHWAP